MYEAKPTGNAEFDKQEALRYVAYFYRSRGNTKLSIGLGKNLLVSRGIKSAVMLVRRQRHLEHLRSNPVLPAPHHQPLLHRSRSLPARPESVRTADRRDISKRIKSTAPTTKSLRRPAVENVNLGDEASSFAQAGCSYLSTPPSTFVLHLLAT